MFILKTNLYCLFIFSKVLLSNIINIFTIDILERNYVQKILR